MVHYKPIIFHYQPPRGSKKCSGCNGRGVKGRLKFSGNKVCNICNGRGFRVKDMLRRKDIPAYLYPFDDPKGCKQCPKCKGLGYLGRLKFSGNKVCNICNGRGYIKK